MDIAMRLNVLAVCAAFVFVGAIYWGPSEFRERDFGRANEGSSDEIVLITLSVQTPEPKMPVFQRR